MRRHRVGSSLVVCQISELNLTGFALDPQVVAFLERSVAARQWAWADRRGASGGCLGGQQEQCGYAQCGDPLVGGRAGRSSRRWMNRPAPLMDGGGAVTGPPTPATPVTRLYSASMGFIVCGRGPPPHPPLRFERNRPSARDLRSLASLPTSTGRHLPSLALTVGRGGGGDGNRGLHQLTR